MSGINPKQQQGYIWIILVSKLKNIPPPSHKVVRFNVLFKYMTLFSRHQTTGNIPTKFNYSIEQVLSLFFSNYNTMTVDEYN